jgi:hypothetical protein
MLAYKFRSSKQIDWALDIICEQRLHCPDWSTFNDPREGFFEYSAADSQKAEAIIRAKTRYRICCLSKSIESRLLWAHYAAGFDGLAVELELPDNQYGIHHVTYDFKLPHVAQQYDLGLDDMALSFLKRKDHEWVYEKEVRIIQESEWYPLSTPVKKVVVGHRFDKPLLQNLRTVCERKSIDLKCTSIENEGVRAIDPNG